MFAARARRGTSGPWSVPAVLGLLLAAALAGEVEAQIPANVRVVDSSAPPGGNGTSWATAFADLQDALDASLAPGNGIEEIWVAEGSNPQGYVPSKPVPPADVPLAVRMVTFNLHNADPILGSQAFGLYGGFRGNDHPAGGETLRSQRNPELNETVLNGAGIAPPPEFTCPEHTPAWRCDPPSDCFEPQPGAGCVSGVWPSCCEWAAAHLRAATCPCAAGCRGPRTASTRRTHCARPA